MTTISLTQSILGLLAGIILIVLLTARFRVHAFFALLLASILTGIILQLPVTDILGSIKSGIGNIMGSLGLLIILGTTLGLILEHSGSTTVLANYVLRRTGTGRSAMAMNIIGYLVGMPIFCDSGFIVLSGLNKALAKRSGIPMIMMASSLATGLYAVHCLMPPHPGITAATGTLHAETGKVILYGLLIAIPASIAGYLWSAFAARHIAADVSNSEETTEAVKQGPSVLMSVLPVAVPVLLIAIRSLSGLETSSPSPLLQSISILGIPEVAIGVGILLALTQLKSNRTHILQEGAEKAAGILVIIGGGGAFGAILAKADIGSHIAQYPSVVALGLLLPFLVTALLKTAQGSSTVAVIAAAAILQPLLPAMGLDSANGRILCVLAMGAGSMMISHTNDAYFWVISKFSGLEIKDMLRVYSTGTVVMGVVSVGLVYLLSLLLA
ncbi:GntP family permease [Chitinophaga arvensicola]|uniref:Predicted D-glycerate permease n=1 Tax=Chitinophaga arvensicola TaxID=29529 RepID=A0A1I0RF28_9BACT|nr:GntP family permease [Chitinophaga arvensicola]SEW39474.1 predicted D-glycerate permease [Chitinophaga arvensicola]